MAFSSNASSFVANDNNNAFDVFVHDRQVGTTECISLTPAGVTGDQHSYGAVISADGRFVAFTSAASNLVPGGVHGYFQIYARDHQSGTTELISVSTSGAPGNGGGDVTPAISSDGRFVAFTSPASDLVAGDANGVEDVFVRDRRMGTTELVSIDSASVQGNGASFFASISADGRYVAFQSIADNLVPGDTNHATDIFVRDRQTHSTERVSIDSIGRQGNDISEFASISADGRYVAFASLATNLVPGNAGTHQQIYVHDRRSGATTRVSESPLGLAADDDCGAVCLSMSADGRYVAYNSLADNLVQGDTNHTWDVFIRDRLRDVTERVSLSSGGAQGNNQSFGPALSIDGRYVAFISDASNLVVGDTNGNQDTFVRDRDATGFTSLCDPGVAGVTACPCSNPPGSGDSGCDNSSATGGARLTASGMAYLSIDSLIFTTNGEKPTATSILLQGTAAAASGVVYGQGVRCVGGTLKRLFTKTAVAGSITAPDFGSGDPTVSARSAAKGDVIQAGQSRWYLVYYRDSVVLGGCPASSTFNATQTGQVTWWP
jgi:Tol biopolymer transport system component